MIISHNLSAINAHRIYQKNTRSLNNTLERLSTGLRISKAADDAAGLSISEKMRAQIKGLRQASRNAQDGISLIQTAEGGLNEINSSLIRIRELSIQAANDTLTSSDKIEIQKEIDQLTDEIDRIAHTTKFNQKTILNGSTSAHWSSDDLNTQAMIQGELVSVSSLGQINSVEGNYNINITSEETGEAEVLKSNIFEVAEIEQVTKTREVTELVEVTKTREVTGVKVEWDKVFEGYSLNASIRQTTDGGYVLLKDSGELLYQDYGIIRMDSDGTAFQGIILGGSLDEEARSIQQTTDGGFIVAGNSNSNDGIVSGNHGGYDYWIVKLNSDGTLDWEKSLGGSGDDRVSSIQQTTDGGYIVAGYSNSNDGDVSGNHGSVDCWVTKLDASGNLLWDKNLGGSDYDAAYSIQQTTDGGYIVAGASLSNDGDVSGNHGGYDYWIVKLNSDGTLDWEKSLGGSDHDAPSSIQQTTDGGYIVAGASLSNDGDVSGNHGGYDYWIVKLNSDGTLDWEKSLGGSDYDGASSIQQTTDGGYIVAGRSKSNDGDVSENSDNDSWIVKLSNKQTYTEEFTEWEEVTSTEEYTEVRTIYHTLENSMGITEPTELIVYQGENIVKVTINPSDNFETLVQKLNQVIAEDLNQGKYVDNTSKFVTFADGTEATSEALYRMETGDDGVQKKFSTVLIRTVIPGEIGRIHISGDEKILNALGFSSIQKAKDSTFLLDATDAHSGKVVQKKTFVKGNSMESFLGSPVGLRFNPMAGIEATWDESTKKFSFSSAADSYRTNLHLVSTGMKVHTGSNQKDDLEITIGDMSAKGINLIPPRLCVFTRELAEQAIEKADKAIGNVSSERSKIGALQNRLEKSINVAENAVENLVTAESRIRDADMAKQTMIMTKQQMLMQSAQSMLAQANQLSNTLYESVRGMMGS